MEEERDALRREAAAMAASAAAAGEDRARTALSARSDCHPNFLPWPQPHSFIISINCSFIDAPLIHALFFLSVPQLSNSRHSCVILMTPISHLFLH